MEISPNAAPAPHEGRGARVADPVPRGERVRGRAKGREVVASAEGILAPQNYGCS